GWWWSEKGNGCWREDCIRFDLIKGLTPSLHQAIIKTLSPLPHRQCPPCPKKPTSSIPSTTPPAPSSSPTPGDIGTAKLLVGMGFQALATTSAGYAYTRGLSDYQVDRDQMLAHVKELAEATDLPVSADMESGYADTLEGIAETYRLTAQAGAV